VKSPVTVDTFPRCHYQQRAASHMKYVYRPMNDVSMIDSTASQGTQLYVV